MSNFLTIESKGFDKAISQFDIKSLGKEFEAEIHAFGMDVARDAKQLLSTDLLHSNGGLINSVFFEPLQMAVEIGASKDYAAYVEFGTGRFAAIYVPSIEPEWQEYAKSFYINGKGRMPATPFLYPAFEKNKIKLIKRLKELLNERRK